MSLRAALERFRERGWTIKVVPKSKKEMSVFHLTSLDLLRAGVIGFLTLLVVFGYFLTRRTQETAAFRILQNQLQCKQQQVDMLQHQKAQVETLLNQEANKLENHLKDLRRQENGIRKLLGQERKNVRQVAYHPFGRKSSRGGSYSDLIMRLSSLQEQIGLEELQLGKTRQAALARHRQIEEQRRRLAAIFSHVPSLWPVDGEVTSGFGYRGNPMGEGAEFHEGIDIAAPYGTPIHAAATGVCVYSAWEEGFGYTVKVDQGNGIITQYSHCSRLLVRAGQEINQGETVALLGSTGYSTGPHLHYEVFFHDQPVNPMRYIGLTINRLANENISSLISER